MILGDIFDIFNIKSITEIYNNNVNKKLMHEALSCECDECRCSRRTYPSGNNIFWQATCKPLNLLQTEGFTDVISSQWYTSGTHFQQQEYSRQIDKRT